MIRRFSATDLKSVLHAPTHAVAPERPVWTGAERPGDEFNRHHSESEILEWLAFEPSHSDHQGAHWTRPGKDSREGSSATVYDDNDGTHVTIWSDTVVGMYPALEVRRPYDAFGLFVGAYYGGDYAKATKDLYGEGYGELPEGLDNLTFIEDFECVLKAEEEARLAADLDKTGWELVNKLAVLRGSPEPAPDLMMRSDGQFLLYRGKVHAFLGEPEGLKSWGAQVAIAQAVEEERDCLMIDFENEAVSVFPRFTALGMSEEDLLAHLDYIAPSSPFTTEAQAQLAKIVAAKSYAIIVVDGVTDAMSLMGLDPEKNKDASTFDHVLLRPLARTGAAVVQVDHVTKSNETRGRWAIGAQHKQAAISGAAFMFEVAQPFGHGMEGMARILIKKDKVGHLRRLAVGETLAELHLKSHEDGHVTHSIMPSTPGESGGFRPSSWMISISDYIEDNPGLPRNAILKGVAGDGKEWATIAFDVLYAEKWIIDDLRSAGKNGYRNLARFTELEEKLGIRSPGDVAPKPDEGPVTNLTPGPIERGMKELIDSAERLHARALKELPGDDEASAARRLIDIDLDAELDVLDGLFSKTTGESQLP